MTDEQIQKYSPILIKQYKDGTLEQREKIIDNLVRQYIPYLKENLRKEFELLIKNNIKNI